MSVEDVESKFPGCKKDINSIEVSNYKLNSGRTDCKYIDASSPEKLIELLHTEAKAI